VDVMLFVLIDSLLDRFSPVTPQREDLLADAELVPSSHTAQDRLMTKYYDNARSPRPNRTSGETPC